MLRKLLYGAAALSAPGIALTVGAERVLRPRLFYHGEWHAAPPDAVRRPYEQAQIFTSDGLELQGWFFPAAAAGAPTLLFCHGTSYSASDMWLTDERAGAFHDFLEGVGCNFLLFDYRGYGRNAGTPTEQRTYIDAGGALAWLHARDGVDPASIFFYGFSMGTGVAAELALREPCAGLILRAPFTSIRGIIADWYPRLRPLLAIAPWLPLTNFDTLAKMPRLQRPLLVMHGEADETVPAYMGQRVFEAAAVPKMYVSFPGGGHTDVNTELVVPAIRQFVHDALSGRLGAASAVAGAAAG